MEGPRTPKWPPLLQDLKAATAAADRLGNPFPVGTSGWVLGPVKNPTLFDKQLPPNAPVSAINQEVGFMPVNPAFASVKNRPKWAIPWLEDDANMIGVQLWAGASVATLPMPSRMVATVCSGFTGGPGCCAEFRRIEPGRVGTALEPGVRQTPDWRADRRRTSARAVTCTLRPRAPTVPMKAAAVYQTACCGMNEYRIQVPNARYQTLPRLD